MIISYKRLPLIILQQQTPEAASAILERITDGFYALDRNWNIIYWNKEAEYMLGRKREAVLGKNLWECFPDGVHLNFYTYYHQAMQEQRTLHFEGYYPPKKVWAEMSVYPSQNGLSVYFKNINERKKAEAQIQLLSLIAKETDNAVSLINHDGTITWVNAAFTTITGYNAEEALGKKHSELLYGPECNEEVIARFKESFYNKAAFSGEIIGYTKSGNKIWLCIAAQPVVDPFDGVEKFFIIQADITEEKILHAALATQQTKMTAAIINAQEKERSLIGKELHDNVNQILTVAKLYLELGASNNGSIQELLTKSASLIQNAIDEIRGLSHRLTAPSLGHFMIAESIADLVTKVSDTGQFQVHADLGCLNGLQVSQELHLAVYRILQEHFSNIIKHAKASQVEVSFSLSDDNLTLIVADDGKGFDTHQRHAGIGLSNMRTRVEGLNGHFSIESTKGKGCRMKALFPLPL